MKTSSQANPASTTVPPACSPAGEFPRMFRLRQRLPTASPVDFAAGLSAALAWREVLAALEPGARIAVAVGSRGIANLSEIVAALLEALRAAGARPFVVPAMGSHGGATAEGQRDILAEYGITEAALGVPIHDTMEVTSLGETPEGIAVWTSRAALDSDGIILVNRVKPHTDFSGGLGSGLSKMSVVGLGKREGAIAFHAAAARSGHAAVLESLARVTLSTLPIIAGVAILEGFHHETARLAVLRREEIAGQEPVLLAEAARLLPRLPFDDLDLLIVDRIGKNISGTGMDPNVTGRYVEGYRSSLGPADGPGPAIRRIFVRALTPETRGNAIGIGMADFTTTRLVQAMDREATFTNALTALSVQAAKIPIHFPTDRETLARALASLGLSDARRARILRIRDTLSLIDLEASEAFVEELGHRSDLESLSAPSAIAFDRHGNLTD
jgi:hypothetical protein